MNLYRRYVFNIQVSGGNCDAFIHMKNKSPEGNSKQIMLLSNNQDTSPANHIYVAVLSSDIVLCIRTHQCNEHGGRQSVEPNVLSRHHATTTEEHDLNKTSNRTIFMSRD